MTTIQNDLFNQPDGLGWCDYNGGIPEKPAPPTVYVISLPNTKSQPFLGGDVPDTQYIKDIVNGEYITTSYHDVTGIKQFSSETGAIEWIESKGVTYPNSGLHVFID